MPAFTPKLNLYKPGGGSSGTITPDEVVDVDRINQNMDLLDAAVGNPDEQNRQWYGPAGSIGSIPDSPKDGDTYQESDGNKILWKRLGGVWVTNEGGAYLIRPGSVSGGATQNVDGSVDIGTGSSNTFMLNGIFTSRFRRYKIIGYVTASVGGYSLLGRFATGGVENTAASIYNNGVQVANGSAFYLNEGASSQFTIAPSNGGTKYFELTIYNPALPVATGFGCASGGYSGAVVASTSFGEYASAVPFDGIRMYMSIAGDFTGGNLQVLGFA